MTYEIFLFLLGVVSVLDYAGNEKSPMFSRSLAINESAPMELLESLR